MGKKILIKKIYGEGQVKGGEVHASWAGADGDCVTGCGLRPEDVLQEGGPSWNRFKPSFKNTNKPVTCAPCGSFLESIQDLKFKKTEKGWM